MISNQRSRKPVFGQFFSERTDEIKLRYETNETISNVTFSPHCSNLLLVSSWDGTVSLVDVKRNVGICEHNHGDAVLDCCFQGDSRCYTGGLDNKVKSFDFNTTSSTILGYHEKPVKAVEYSPEVKLLVTGGWDSQVKMWDSRMDVSVCTLQQPDRVYTLALCGDKFIVGTSGRKIYVWDFRNLGYVLQRRESTLKYQTRCIKSFPNHKGYLISSIEGRVAVEYLDSSPEIQKKKYAFKCHRLKENGTEKIYAVNTLSFHPKYFTFATGGSDGFVNIWDGMGKTRLCQFHQYPLSITSVCFNRDGSALAIAYSHLYDEVQTSPGKISGGSVCVRFPENSIKSISCIW